MNRRLDVVACFSPLFYNERWQLIIPTLEIYRQLGVTLQVYYIQSMLVEILRFIQLYERLNVTKVETWSKLSVMNLNPSNSSLLPLDYDPNAELEWRNQAAAHTDCLLNYREAAEFVIISDIDDVLFPRLGKTFLDEFRILSSQFPAAAGFSYNRYNTELITSNDPDDFSLSALINSARIAREWEDPKYVVKPSYVQSVWLHWPGIMDRGYMQQVPDRLNFMVHFRNWSMVDYGASIMPRMQRSFELFQYQISDVIQPPATADIEANFRKFLKENSPGEILFDNLPRQVRYYPLIAECYNRIFYARAKRPQNCPGPMRCHLPPIEGLQCALANHEQYNHKAINSRVMVHFPNSPQGQFIISHTGCRM
ncbi:glycosyltransferase family 92 domain-containing protein [Ditylenchus destructor]|uniref:Glycosyltransferase family 92 protein n=1 Tax=Ditylenchus destructor TaxID=166010 RepID=A0AAD4NEZ6_9BILA|nr:glycosyltransferase family 92 domain-containing protein [Ditylenchus destructor]